jgi:predicted RNase H-like HicB family nuclease
MKLTAIVEKEGDWYTAWCPDTDIASQGQTVDEALDSLKEALELYLEDEDAKVLSNAPLFTTIEVNLHGKASHRVGI